MVGPAQKDQLTFKYLQMASLDTCTFNNVGTAMLIIKPWLQLQASLTLSVAETVVIAL